MAAKNVKRWLGPGFWLVAVLVATLCAPGVRAQDNAPPQRTVNSIAATNADVTVNEPAKVWIGVRGCLRKGNEPGRYLITGTDGKTWDLVGRHVKLSDHVGQKLDVTGYEVHNPKAKGDQADAMQNTVDNGKPYAAVHVTKIATTGESCGR